jgi:DNA repair ATPase RecN
MTRLTPQYDIDTSAIHKLEEVLKAMQRLAKECGVKLEELFGHYEQLSARLDRIRNARARLITQLDDLLTKTKVAYKEHAHDSD